MGASFSYEQVLPDYGDLDNKTGNCPGHRVTIAERDGGVWIEFEPLKLEKGTVFGAFMNIEEAKEFSDALKESIVRADFKNQKRIVHPRRAKDSKY